ncbi:hypothetical protein [Streptomyces sp. MUM 16J]|nr:hypothetical protein [Streptomyces sp. MUM 16J]
MLYEHGELARSALVTHRNDPNYLRLVETLLALLKEGGRGSARPGRLGH